MDKKEIGKRIEFLRWALKRPGRAYTAEKRQEMKTELIQLNTELVTIKFEEDLLFIEEFEQKHKYAFTYTINSYKEFIYNVMENTNNVTLAFILMYKISKFFKKIDDLEYYNKNVLALKESLKCIENNEKIPYSNENRHFKKEELQSFLASKYKAISSIITNLVNCKNNIYKIEKFYNNQNKTEGFVYLTNAIFEEASNFEMGYSVVIHKGEKKYLSFNGDKYDINTDKNDIPKVKMNRLNPDLVPFEIKDENGKIFKGYKDSNNEIIVSAKYEIAYPFVNGYAKIGIYEVIDEKRNSILPKYGLINAEGRQVLPCEFVELDDVYNDVVRFKKHVYNDVYVQDWINYDVKHQVLYSGFLNGFLILKEIKIAISTEIEAIKKTQIEIQKFQQEDQTLKTQGDIDYAEGKIKHHKSLIDFYLQIIDD